ncbi:MAG: hypothetical protein ACI8QD_001115 [Cyclobacteriaceae bacterium]|jgi:hypothetical protein
MIHKSTILLLLSFTFFTFQSQAQEKVTKDKLLGNWKLVIDIEEELDQEAEEEDNMFAKMIITGVSGLVEGIMENIDVYFEFQSDGEVRIKIDAFDEREVEYAKWYISNRGELIIEDFESDNISFDNDDVWMMDGKRLVSFDDDGSMEENVYMVRIE